MRFRITLSSVPDSRSADQISIMEWEIDWHESRHKVVDVIQGGVNQLVAEGGYAVPGDDPDRDEYDDDRDGKDMDPHY